jgi:dihydropteroate synthase
MKPRKPDRPSYEGPFTRVWRLRHRTISFSKIPRLMGIVNVTPDSFSDGGRWASADLAIEHGLHLAEEGADMLDVGGESTRPYSVPVAIEEEIRRIAPVIRGLARQIKIPISIDTSKSQVAEVALENGAEVINDVTGLEGDARMLSVARRSRAGVCVMHMQGDPQTMQESPKYDDVVEEIFYYLASRRNALMEHGIEMEQICLDPGIGFGKTHQHNLTLLSNYHRFHELGCPLLGGFSRKGFIGKVLGDSALDRKFANIGIALALAAQRVQVLRVHEIAPIRESLQLFAAVGGIDGFELTLPNSP